MFKNKTFFILIIIIIVSFGGFVFYKIRDGKIPIIKTAQVVSGPIEAVVSAAGVVKAPVYELSAKAGGKIDEILIEEGKQVYKGQLLVKFDNYDEAKKNFDRVLYLFKNGLASDQEFDSAKTILEASRIISPGKGRIAKINYEIGETVLPGSIFIVIVDEASRWIEAQIDEIDIGGVKINDRVKILSDVYPETNFSGEIFWISPLAELRKVGGRVKIDEESYIFPCKIKFSESFKELKTNMNVDVEIVTKKSENSLLLPREALMSKDDSSYVFIVKNNRSYQKKVIIGIRSYTNAEILSGLSKGEIVAISNVSKLKNKGRVKHFNE
jgi:RND family efflux transporter MFP subunit